MPADMKEILEEMGAGLKEFKERQGREVEELKAQLREVETVQARGVPLPGAPSHPTASPAVIEAFGAFVRAGDMAPMRNALSVGIDPDGGFMVPREIVKDIERLVRDRSAMRRLARVRPAKGSPLVIPVDRRGATSGWVGEQETRPETDSPELATTEIHLREVYANPKTTQQLLDLMSGEDAGSWLIESAAEEIADQQNAAYVSGDGVKRPRGFLTYPTDLVGDAARPWGTLQHIKTGDASGFDAASATVSPADCLIDVVHSLRSAYRQGAGWLMNSATAAVIRKFKDADGRFVWTQSIQEGQPSMLLGYPVHEDESMPDIAGDALPVAFGNWRRGYTIADFMGGIRTLRDPFTSKPFVYFYTTAYTGGAVTNFEAIKLLKIDE